MSTTADPQPGFVRSLFRRKPIEHFDDSEEKSSGGLVRSIGTFQLTMMGIGATIGTGIFFVLSQAVPVAGPAVIVSFAVAGLVAGLTALCYAELASAVPVSGSSYAYAYATLGELVAIIVGGCLLLEYGVSCAAVAVGWSEYLNELFSTIFHFTIPDALAKAPAAGGFINLPAVILVGLCCLLLIRGASESAKANAVMVVIKLGVLAMFAIVAFFGWNADHFANFAPFGTKGAVGAAGIIFFSFVGLDVVSTAGEEVKHPRTTMPRALILALITVTGFYIIVAVAAIGAQSWEKFEGQDAGLAQILTDVTGAPFFGTILALGAVISIFSVTLVTLYGQTRILFSMSRDGVAPKIFKKVSRRTLTPVQNTIIVCAVVAVLAGFIPIDFLAEMTSVGTLVAFLVVSVGVMILRKTEPDLERGFRVPLYPVIPILSIAGCLWVILNLRAVTLYAFVAWEIVVLIYYFAYGRRHANLHRQALAGGTAATASQKGQ
ncbi:amino acid permease [Brevibacterium sp. BRM-1]|uniref:APC family permease n=1 Tax=Brevibacterium sp. BRM-1 TaxID=2999062 RepID=UPI0022805184|nr:amino acid permease [Brevibacterium sp. BRM-1]WAL40010.1 amino acid permease [Brevibacterium sp. BRM-1]